MSSCIVVVTRTTTLHCQNTILFNHFRNYCFFKSGFNSFCVNPKERTMSFSLPSVKPKPQLEGSMGFSDETPSLMVNGFSSVKGNLEPSHPLEVPEKMYQANRDRTNLRILRNTQGLHAPLKITMELNAAKQIGHLPFLTSSNVMHDVLTGRDLEIGPEDIFNTSEFREVAGQPHAVVERSLGLL